MFFFLLLRLPDAFMARLSFPLYSATRIQSLADISRGLQGEGPRVCACVLGIKQALIVVKQSVSSPC